MCLLYFVTFVILLLVGKSEFTSDKEFRHNAQGMFVQHVLLLVSERKLSVMHSLRLGGKNSCHNFLVHPQMHARDQHQIPWIATPFPGNEVQKTTTIDRVSSYVNLKVPDL